MEPGLEVERGGAVTEDEASSEIYKIFCLCSGWDRLAMTSS